MRAVPAATVNRPPHTAAASIATPSGRVHCQPRKANCADAVFCAMKISRTIPIKNPGIRAHQSAAVLVNLTAFSRGGAGLAAGAGLASDAFLSGWAGNGGGGVSPGIGERPPGRSGDTEGSLVMGSSLPFQAANETTCPIVSGGACGERTLGMSIAMPNTRRRCLALFAAVLVLVTAACGSSNPLGGGEISGDLKSIVVGSADFPESKIIAEIWAQSLEANGFTVRRQFGIGSRETYIPAVRD